MSFATSYAGYSFAGLGDADKQAQIAQITTTAVSGVGATLTPVIAHSIFAGAAGAAMPAFAIPVVGAAIFGITLALSAILGRKGPKQKEAATKAVQQVEQLMRDNLNAYMAGPRTPDTQLMAKTNFEQAWAWMTGPDGCGNPALGDAGKRCISERQRGGNIGQTGDNPWCTDPKGCDMWVTMYDPIVNDPHPAEFLAAQQATGGDGSNPLAVLTSSASSGSLPLLLGGGLLIAAAFLGLGGGK